MKLFYEFEVIIPNAVFDHVSVDLIVDLLSYFNVKFECKGYTDCKTEFLVTAHSRDVAYCVREWFPALQSVVVASSYSAMDKMRCRGWLYGEIREVESD
jgi:hypothetical protein